ncbi:plasmid pRiA4b ORF-3 family protein [Wenzhouxiangella sp. EGI_FJ10305]|uniref:plasmid pRiA4b ORF-3 family protein n=1 Tax=Wenzhouxiangella sp. EGI_FJ10305 TaxID=3243768 RepID=UPI0035DD33AB
MLDPNRLLMRCGIIIVLKSAMNEASLRTTLFRQHRVNPGNARKESSSRPASPNYPGGHRVFQYLYDFGDDWIHRIEVEDTNVSADPGWIPWLIDGARRGPPEDCGGVPGYQRLIEAANAPPETLNEDELDFVGWAGDGFDPEEFSVFQARHSLLLSAGWGCLKGR